MYKLTDQAVDLTTESYALAEYLSSRWEPSIPWVDVVETALGHALEDGRALFDPHRVWEKITALEDVRDVKLQLRLDPSKAAFARYHDMHAVLLNEMRHFLRPMREAALSLDGQWDYEAKARAVLQAARTFQPEIDGVRPKGWDALRANYSDHDGCEEYCETQQQLDHDEFKGADSEGLRSPGFTSRVALPYVMYDDVCQGRKPAYVAVSAIYGHFLHLVEHQNTLDMIERISSMDESVSQSPLTFDLPPSLAALNEHPLTSVLAKLAQEKVAKSGFATKATFDQAVAGANEWKNLPAEAQEERKQDNSKQIAQLLDKLKSESKDSQPDPDVELAKNALHEQFSGDIDGADRPPMLNRPSAG